jgi:lipopolysaccharide export system permease protein
MIFYRYLGRSIWQSTLFVLLGFLSMFTFFDFLAEVDEVGIGSYQIEHAIAFVLLGIPSRVVELAPIAALIGTLWALSQSAASSEFTVFRVSGLLPRASVIALVRIGLPMVLLTVFLSEFLVPASEEFRSRVRDGFGSSSPSGQLRSGLWLRDTVSSSGAGQGGSRFINVAALKTSQELSRITVYDFNAEQRLVQEVHAESASFIRQDDAVSTWQLSNVQVVSFAADGGVNRRQIPTQQLVVPLSLNALDAVITSPELMSSLDLYRYIQYLKQNKLDSSLYEISLWKGLVYPFVIWVMMLLALPAAYLQARAGAVGARVLAGILVGIGFHLLNSLFSHLGVLTTWPAPLMAALPSLMALMLAGIFFYWVNYRR